MITHNKQFIRKVLAIAIPITLQHLITTGVNVMDTVMLGRLGEVSISASSLANQFIAIHQIMCVGLGTGATILATRAWGAGNVPVVKKSITMVTCLNLLVATVGFLLAFFLPERIMAIFTADRDVIREGAVYLRWSVTSFYFGGIAFVTVQVLRGVGCNRLPLVSSIAAFVVNVAANYIFIFGKLGAPRMGIAGAALGTAIARLVEFGITFYYLFFLDRKILFRPRDFLLPCGDILKPFFSVSIPVIVSETFQGLGNSAIAVIIGHIGSGFVAANAIAAVVTRVATLFAAGFTSSATIMTGTTLGEGDEASLKEQNRAFLLLGAGIGLLAMLTILLVTEPMLAIYSISDETAGISREILRAVAITTLFLCFGNMITQIIRGGGDTRFLLVTDTLTLWLLTIPLGALCGLHLQLPVFWVYCSLRANQILRVPICWLRLRSGKWIHRLGVERDAG